MWFSIIMFVISLVLKVVSYLMRPKPKPPQSATPGELDDMGIPECEEGEHVPVLFGNRCITPQVIWYGDFDTVPIMKSSSSGGKKG